MATSRGVYITQIMLSCLNPWAIRRESTDSAFVDTASGFSGLKAFEHYLLCVQLVLRKQVKWMVEERGLPQELEVRDRAKD